MNSAMQQLINAINRSDYPFRADLKNDDTVEIMWRWKDAVSLGWGSESITDEVRDFKYFVTFLPGNKYKTSSTSSTSSVNFNASNGTVTFVKSSFSGQQTGVHKEIDLLSLNRKNGKAGVNTFDFDTKHISEPVKKIMESLGYKKKGLFG